MSEERTQWLVSASDYIGTWIQHATKRAVPECRIGVGYGAGGRRGNRTFWITPAEQVADGVAEITIALGIDNADDASAALAAALMELVGADCEQIGMATAQGQPCWSPQGRRMMGDIGLTDDLGEYPAAAVTPPKKQTSRQVKCTCGECGAVWRMSRKWIEAAGESLSCPVCLEQGKAETTG